MRTNKIAPKPFCFMFWQSSWADLGRGWLAGSKKTRKKKKSQVFECSPGVHQRGSSQLNPTTVACVPCRIWYKKIASYVFWYSPYESNVMLFSFLINSHDVSTGSLNHNRQRQGPLFARRGHYEQQKIHLSVSCDCLCHF